MDRLLATKSEGVGLIVCAISFQDFQPMWSQITNVTDGQTDGQHAIPRTRICTKVHCAVIIKLSIRQTKQTNLPKWNSTHHQEQADQHRSQALSAASEDVAGSDSGISVELVESSGKTQARRQQHLLSNTRGRYYYYYFIIIIQRLEAQINHPRCHKCTTRTGWCL